MFEKLYSYINRRVPITEEQFDVIKREFIPKSVKKGEFLLREGEIAKYSIFVTLGCLRTYTVDNKGKEHITQFSPEDWWTGDMNSLIKEAPSECFIEALEDSEVLLAEKGYLEKMMQVVPGVALSYQAGLEKSLIARNQRIVASLSASAEERYNDFMKTYPSLAQRVPQHMIASYLGVSPETLSRIRKQQSQKR